MYPVSHSVGILVTASILVVYHPFLTAPSRPHLVTASLPPTALLLVTAAALSPLLVAVLSHNRVPSTAPPPHAPKPRSQQALHNRRYTTGATEQLIHFGDVDAEWRVRHGVKTTGGGGGVYRQGQMWVFPPKERGRLV